MNAEMQMKLAEAKAQTQVTYFLMLLKISKPFHFYLWNSTASILQTLGETDPERWIGKQPTKEISENG